MIKYLPLSEFLEDEIVNIVKEEQVNQELRDNYNFSDNYIIIPAEELRILQKKLYKKERAIRLSNTSPYFDKQKVKTFTNEFFIYQDYLLNKYLKNTKYSFFEFDFIQEKLFYYR